jgi:hypothetical protein
MIAPEIGGGKMEEDAKTAPPYAAFATFRTFIDKMTDSVVPTSVDRNVLASFSGSSRLALVPGLKFLGLLEGDDNKTTDRLRTLVEARTGGEGPWKAELHSLLQDAYRDIIAGVDLERGTASDLETAFKQNARVEGSVQKKAIRFFLYGLKEAGVTVSPHMTGRRVGGSVSNGRKPRRRKPAVPDKPHDAAGAAGVITGGGPQPRQRHGPPEGYDRLPILGREDAFIQYPVPLTESDCEVIAGAVNYLRVLLKVQEKGGKS